MSPSSELDAPDTDTPLSFPSAPHQHLGDYEILEEIARGGMGIVYRARQVSLNRPVALKMILAGQLAQPSQIVRFYTEARSAARLDHPNIVPIYEIGELEGRHFYSMKLMDGGTLAQQITSTSLSLSHRETAARVAKLARAVHFAHQRGVLHRDLKPSNILLDSAGEPHVADFGVARIAEENTDITRTNTVLGSPAYMPPEQAAGGTSALTTSADIYSLGAILYELLTGQPPFSARTPLETLRLVTEQEPADPRRLNPAVDLDLATICLKCLGKEPSLRYSTAEELAEDLEHFLAGELIMARPASTLEKARRWCRRRPAQAALTLALLLTLAGGIAGVLAQAHRANRHALETQLNLYAADVSAASQAIERGDFGLGRRLLETYLPAAQEEQEADLRGFEWHYLWNRSRGDHLATLSGHPWIVTRVGFSPDGRFLASGSQATLGSAGEETTVRIWNPISHELIQTLPPGLGTIWSLAFSPDSKLLLTAGSARQVRFWDTKTWQPLGEPIVGQFAALSSNGSLLATADSSPFYWEAAGKVGLWDYHKRQLLTQTSVAGRFLAFSPDDRWLAIAGPEKDIFLWNIKTGNVDRVLPTSKAVWMMTFSTKGDRLASVGWSDEALLFDPHSGDALGQLSGHLLTVWSVAFSPDGHSLATSGSDQTIRLWDSSTLAPQGILRGHENEVWSAAFSPDGRWLASGGKDRSVRLWSSRIASEPVLPSNESFARPFLSPDGSRLLVFSPTNATRRPMLWETRPPRLVCEIVDTYPTGFSTDGKSLARLHHVEPDLEFFEPPNGPVTRRISLQGLRAGHSLQTTGFAPHYDFFFGVDTGGTATIWHTESGRRIASFTNVTVPVRGRAMSPHGQFLALSSERDKEIRLCDLRTGQARRLNGHHDFVSGLAFSPDGRLLASGSVDAAIKLWDTADGREVGALLGHMEEATDLSFSPDGRTLASLGQFHSVKFWNLPTRREVASIALPQAESVLQFSPDGAFLIVNGSDNVLRFLEAPR